MRYKRDRMTVAWMLLATLALLASATGGRAEKISEVDKPAERFAFAHPYGGPEFTSLVRESERVTGVATAKDFATWMDGPGLRAAREHPAGKLGLDWNDMLKRHRLALEATRDPEERARKEMALGTWLHATIKRAIPNYNLDLGFELVNVARREERQCLLQSVIISSLLQAMGVDAGIAMVNQNREGQYTNNTHVIVMLKLANGRDAIVDGSYKETLVAHRGLMAMLPERGYRYVRPVYTSDFRYIVSYREAPSGAAIPTVAVRPMDIHFVRSQFDFYRGERAPGGVLARQSSAAGLQRSARFFESSLEHGPRNPLPAYFLALTYEKQGRAEAAYQQYLAARSLYNRAGWAPRELTRALNRTRGGP